MNRSITTIVTILSAVAMLAMLIWLGPTPLVWVGIGTIAMLVGTLYEYRQNRPSPLRRRNLLVMGSAYAFLIIAYALSVVPPS